MAQWFLYFCCCYIVIAGMLQTVAICWFHLPAIWPNRCLGMLLAATTRGTRICKADTHWIRLCVSSGDYSNNSQFLHGRESFTLIIDSECLDMPIEFSLTDTVAIATHCGQFKLIWFFFVLSFICSIQVFLALQWAIVLSHRRLLHANATTPTPWRADWMETHYTHYADTHVLNEFAEFFICVFV